jgi:hypothetical protein
MGPRDAFWCVCIVAAIVIGVLIMHAQGIL